VKVKENKDKRMVHCGLCNVDIPDGNWDKHKKSKQHQKYLNDPTLISKMLGESQANLFRAMIGARQVHVKHKDQINKNSADDLWNWHVAVRDSGGDKNELHENIKAIFQFLISKYGQKDYRTLHVKGILDQGLSDVQDLEDIRYIIHAEAEGITHETNDVHGLWLKSLKEEKEKV